MNAQPLTEQQERLARALRSFPQEVSEESLGWPEGFKLYGALRNLPQSVLKASGRFLYSDISTLKTGEYYLLGYNPGGDPKNEPTHLEDEIRGWFAKDDNSYNAYVDERWLNHEKGKAPLQEHVNTLLEAIGTTPRDVCASNLHFSRSKRGGGEDDLELSTDFSVHKAILGIINPSCIIAFGKSTYDVVKADDELRLRQREGEKGRFLIGEIIFKKEPRNGYCYVADGLHLGKPLTLIGLPHLTYYDPRVFPTPLEQIVKICHTAVGQ